MAFAKFFYPRLVYNGITIDAAYPALVTVPPEIPIRGQNTSLGGVMETLYQRMETQILITFQQLDAAALAALRTYWSTWGARGKQAALTLDRLGTCAGQYEYDQFNAFFTKAELLNNPWQPARRMMGGAIYVAQFQFRQGA